MSHIDPHQLSNWIWQRDRFPRPDWNIIAQHIHQNLPETDWENAWCQAAHLWLDETRQQLPDGYKIYQSPNFYLLADLQDDVCDYLLRKAEESLAMILKTLGDAADDSGHGKHVIMCFSKTEDAVDYFVYYYGQDDHYMMPAGVFLDAGYGHFVLNYDNTFDAVRTITHELTHACLNHRPLPVWLNEGVALNAEELVSVESWGSQLDIDHEQKQMHLDYWDASSIQSFWTGESFPLSGEASDLSYNLAAILVFQIANQHKKLQELLTLADHSDYGARACLETLGFDLNALVSGFLGEGDWAPSIEQHTTPETS
jgi:hypothetical protein